MKPPSPTALLATLALAGLSLALAPRSALAGPAIGAIAATASSMQAPETAPEYSIDQSGLSLAYLPSVTDFDSYLGAAPMHASAGPNSWLSAIGDTTPTLWLDLGVEQTIDALALWVSDYYPPLLADVSVSLDGVSYSPVLADQALVPGVAFAPVAAQVLGFGAAVQALHVRLDFSCPIDANGGNLGCGIAEVVFRGAAQAVPAPATAALVLLPLAMLVARSRPGATPRQGTAR